MYKKYLYIAFILSFVGSYYTYSQSKTNFTNYFKNMSKLEKDMIRMYGLQYPNAFIIINMFI